MSDGVKEFEDTKSGITAKLSSGKELNADLVILAIGVKPDIKLAKEAGLGVKRGIVTN